MKKHLLSVIAASSVFTAFAQLPVSHLQEHKKAVLEEFTGIYCGYCPDGHRIANSIYYADPSNVVLINIHSGGYANVATGEPDFKTAEGTAIDGMSGVSGTLNVSMGITGYPAGDMNRTAFQNTPTATPPNSVMSGGRGSWPAWASNIKSQNAYCNVALQGTLDVTTRVITVVAEVYYTGSSPDSTNYLNLFLLEDSVTGPQHNYGTPTLYNAANYNADGTYNHNHVLRKALTPTFGLAIPNTTTGTTFTTMVSYTVPVTYGASGKTNPCTLGNLKLVGFVTESSVNTINANHGPIALTGFANAVDIGTNSLSAEKTTCSQNLHPTLKFNNYGSSAVTDAVFSYSLNNVAVGNYSWTGHVNPQSISSTIYVPTFFTPLAAGNNTLSMSVVSVNGVADQNASNNISTFKNITKSTPRIVNDVDLTVNFTQDQYGTEDSWLVLDEISGDTIATDGPFANLSAVGVLLHSKSFSVDENTCYILVANDAYGDGINTTYGAGHYEMVTSAGDTVITSNGTYLKSESTPYKTYSTVGIAGIKMNIGTVKVYPNPTSGVANIAIDMKQNDALNITVMNSIGQQVYSVKSKAMDAGVNTITLNTENWAGGVYFINISSPKGSLNQKLTVTK